MVDQAPYFRDRRGCLEQPATRARCSGSSPRFSFPILPSTQSIQTPRSNESHCNPLHWYCPFITAVGLCARWIMYAECLSILDSHRNKYKLLILPDGSAVYLQAYDDSIAKYYELTYLSRATWASESSRHFLFCLQSSSYSQRLQELFLCLTSH